MIKQVKVRNFLVTDVSTSQHEVILRMITELVVPTTVFLEVLVITLGTTNTSGFSRK